MSKSGLITKLKIIFNSVSLTETMDDKATSMGTDIYDEVSDISPAGTILPYGNSIVPAGYLECNGSAISRSTYANLFAIIGENFGEGNGTTTFNIPDLRGQFLRGYDNGAGTDPDAAGRTAMATGGASGDNVGSIQTDENKEHTHTVPIYYYDSGTRTVLRSSVALAQDTNYIIPSSGGNESRPINASIMFIIKY